MRILLLRHAKSSWDRSGLRDHDRPLAGRGKRAAPAMGADLAETDCRVDRIVSSTAARAVSTARLFRERFDPVIPISTRRELYNADARTLLEIARDEATGADDRILLVGHNPGMHDLAVFLCGEGDGDMVARLHAKFPTGALAEFDLAGPPTAGLRRNSARLVRFVRPKDLPSAKRLRL